jgi:hypothetical protein
MSAPPSKNGAVQRKSVLRTSPIGLATLLFVACSGLLAVLVLVFGHEVHFGLA